MNIMINPEYMKYIPDEKKDECYYTMLNDVYYFYNNIKPTPNQYIILLNNNKFDLSKSNLLLVDRISNN